MCTLFPLIEGAVALATTQTTHRGAICSTSRTDCNPLVLVKSEPLMQPIGEARDLPRSFSSNLRTLKPCC
jgi:hypothetical protein